MGFLRRLGIGGRPPAGPVPDWAAFMSPAEYARFREIIAAWLSGHSITWREEHGGGLRAWRQGETGDGRIVGLLNLAQTCHAIAPEGWEQQVAVHLGTLFFEPLSRREQSLEEIHDRLKVRIYPADYLDPVRQFEPGQEPIVWPLAPGIVAMLAEDLPTAVRTIHASALERWGLSRDEAWDLGLANVRREDRPGPVGDDPSDPGGFMGDSFFTTTWVLMLDELLPNLPEAGAVVVLPMRHLLWVQPMRDLGIAQKIGQLVQLGAKYFAQGPGSISPSLYWWRRGQPLMLLPSTADGGRSTFSPPPDFLAALETLPPPAGR